MKIKLKDIADIVNIYSVEYVDKKHIKSHVKAIKQKKKRDKKLFSK